MSSIISVPFNTMTASTALNSSSSNKHAKNSPPTASRAGANETVIVLSSPPPAINNAPTPERKTGKSRRHSSPSFFSNFVSSFLGFIAAITFCVAVPVAIFLKKNPVNSQNLKSWIADLKRLPAITRKLLTIGKSIEKQNFEEQVAWLGDLGNELKKGGLKENALKLNSYLGHTTHLLDRANQNGLLNPELVDKVGKQMNTGWTGWLLGTSK